MAAVIDRATPPMRPVVVDETAVLWTVFDPETGSVRRSYKWRLRRASWARAFRAWRPRIRIRINIALFPKMSKRLARLEREIELLDFERIQLRARVEVLERR